jgi:hypothetical protein
VAFDLVLAIDRVEARDVGLISASKSFSARSGRAEVSVAPDREDKTESVESPLTVLSTGTRVRGRVSVAGSCFSFGRLGVCRAWPSEGESRGWEAGTEGFELVTRVGLAVPCAAGGDLGLTGAGVGLAWTPVTASTSSS